MGRESTPHQKAQHSRNFPEMKRARFAIGIVLLMSSPGVRAEAAKPTSGAHLIATPAETKARLGETGLLFSVGNRGLDSLSYNGQSLLVSPGNGELQPQRSVFRAVLDALLPASQSGVAAPNKQADTIDLSYRWGHISCAYGKQEDRITMRILCSLDGTELSACAGWRHP